MARLISTLLLGLLCATASADITTYGFDKDVENDGRPDNWRNITDRPREYWPDPPSARLKKIEGRSTVHLVFSRGNRGIEYDKPIALARAMRNELTVTLKTRRLIRGRACLEVTLLDAQRRPLEVRRTPLIHPENWTTLTLSLTNPPKGASQFRLRCLLLGNGDVRGEAYFDAIRLTRSPRRILHTPWATVGRFHTVRRIWPSGAPATNVRLALNLSGAKPSKYRLVVTLRDQNKRLLQASEPWHLKSSYGVGTLDIALRETGFYVGQLQLIASKDKRVVLTHPLELVIYDSRTALFWGRTGPVGVALRDDRFAQRWPGLARLMLPGKFRLPIDPALQPTPSEDVLAALGQLREQHVQVIGMLLGKNFASGLIGGRKPALEQLTAALRNYGGHITTWQLGSDADGKAWQPAAARALFLKRLPALRRKAKVAASFGLPDTGGASFQVQSTPAGRAGSGDVVILPVPARPLASLASRKALARLAVNLIERQIDGIGAVLMRRPGTESWLAHDRAHPELLIARAVNGFLGPAPHLTTLEGSIRVFQHRGKTVLAIWNDTNKTPVRLYPGRKAQAWDLFGSPIPLGGEGNETTKALFQVMAQVGSEPYFVTGVDTPWLKTQLSTKFDPSPLKSRQGKQSVSLQVTNHFSDRRRFIFYLYFPDGFKSPLLPHSLVLDAGQTGKITVPVEVGPVAYTGKARAEIFGSVIKGNQNRGFSRFLGLKLTSGIEVQLVRKGDGLLVTIINNTDQLLDTSTVINLPTGLRKSFTTVGLAPNSSRSKELQNLNATGLVGQVVEVSLRESSTGRFLHAKVVVK